MKRQTTTGARGVPAFRVRAGRRGPLALHLFVMTIVAFGALADAGQQPASSATEKTSASKPPAPSVTQDLVDAGQANKSKRKKSTTKVITNADVKKSKAKLVETGASTAPVKREPSMLEKQAADKAARADADATRAATQELIDELEIELTALEQSYYDESDLNRRDTEIVKRFNDVKARLDAAKSALAQIP
jgi:hypothetical protein